jgi:hypothetical protein
MDSAIAKAKGQAAAVHLLSSVSRQEIEEAIAYFATMI